MILFKKKYLKVRIMDEIFLHNEHVRLGGKMVDFAGFKMPVQYTGIIEEHQNVRERVGLFDISHMGELLIQGKDATPFLQNIMVNDLDLLYDGKAQYSTICAENGGTIEDTFYYRHSIDKYRIIINASNREKDINWFQSHSLDLDVNIEDLSNKRGRFALQGPLAEKVLDSLISSENISELKRFHFIETKMKDTDVFIARTGYTAEDGFEISFNIEDSLKVWRSLMEGGKKHSIMPIGLGARNTLRLEASYSLYGHELTTEITPVEAGIGWLVKEKKEADFIGKEVLLSQKRNGTSRKIVGLELIERGIMRDKYQVFVDENKVGYITSGSFSPTFKKSIALAMLDIDYTSVGTEVLVEIRKKRVLAQVVKTPFYVYKSK